MNTRTLKVLPSEEWRVIKQITIVSDLIVNRDISIGYILYERNLSENYKFTETPKEEKDFFYYLDYPKQENYPHDNIDDLILQAVKNSNPKSVLKSSNVICNIDYERLDLLRKRSSEKAEMIFTPDFTTIKNLYGGQQFAAPAKDINVYSDFSKEHIQNFFFNGYYNVQHRGIVNEIEAIIFL